MDVEGPRRPPSLDVERRNDQTGAERPPGGYPPPEGLWSADHHPPAAFKAAGRFGRPRSAVELSPHDGAATGFRTRNLGRSAHGRSIRGSTEMLRLEQEPDLRCPDPASADWATRARG